MIKLLKKIWDKMNEPQNEQVLIVLLPCIAILTAGFILAPRLFYFISDPLIKENLPPSPSPLPTADLVEIQVITPTITPEPVIVFEEFPTPSEPATTIPEFLYDDYGNPDPGLKNIDGKIYYFNQHGQRAKSLGIDVSFYNKGINWPAVKAQGIDFAIIRAGGRGWETGLIYDDDCFRQNLDGARAAGLKVGVYFYSTAINAAEAVQEANYVIKCLNGTKLDFPIFFDIEQSGEYPYGRADRLNKTLRSDTVNAFCSTVVNSGYRAGIYSGQSFLKYHIDYNSLSQYYIWLASYTRNNRLPSFSAHYDMWQFTDSGVVNGIRGKVDMNAIF